MKPLAAATVAEQFRVSCRAELEALKPGNVHIHADGHGMTVADFLRSADAAAPGIAAAGAPVGARIFRAIEATHAAVGQNTNLGIVLLCAPIAAAAELGGDLRRSLQRVLDGLTHADAALAYQAIRLAAPGGLGSSRAHDVADEPEVTLLEAMRSAARRDRIARQYASGFCDVRRIGVRRLLAGRAAGWPEPRAVTATYLDLLAAFPDTHVLRKHGRRAADRVRSEARALVTRLEAADDSGLPPAELLSFDRGLKSRGINPGTSADLTVAALFYAGIDHDRLE